MLKINNKYKSTNLVLFFFTISFLFSNCEIKRDENNAVNGKSDNPVKDIPLLDTYTDQQAIKDGFNYPKKP